MEQLVDGGRTIGYQRKERGGGYAVFDLEGKRKDLIASDARASHDVVPVTGFEGRDGGPVLTRAALAEMRATATALDAKASRGLSTEPSDATSIRATQAGSSASEHKRSAAAVEAVTDNDRTRADGAKNAVASDSATETGKSVTATQLGKQQPVSPTGIATLTPRELAERLLAGRLLGGRTPAQELAATSDGAPAVKERTRAPSLLDPAIKNFKTLFDETATPEERVAAQLALSKSPDPLTLAVYEFIVKPVLDVPANAAEAFELGMRVFEHLDKGQYRLAFLDLQAADARTKEVVLGLLSVIPEGALEKLGAGVATRVVARAKPASIAKTLTKAAVVERVGGKAGTVVKGVEVAASETKNVANRAAGVADRLTETSATHTLTGVEEGGRTRIPRGMSLHEMYEPKSRAMHFPAARDTIPKQPGVDWVMGGERSARTAHASKEGTTYAQTWTGGSWIQNKRLWEQAPSTMTAAEAKLQGLATRPVEQRAAAAVKEALAKFGRPLESGASRRTGKMVDGVAESLTLRQPDELIINIEIPEFASMKPEARAHLQSHVEKALANGAPGQMFMGVPIRVQVVGTP
ncbi:hypothetical protein [Microbacterium sp.]|uniref:hypothetical protein n=1 Tax=Microbacterium sp. TaxID=51671 RepID=UPI0039E45D33